MVQSHRCALPIRHIKSQQFQAQLRGSIGSEPRRTFHWRLTVCFGKCHDEPADIVGKAHVGRDRIEYWLRVPDTPCLLVHGKRAGKANVVLRLRIMPEEGIRIRGLDLQTLKHGDHLLLGVCVADASRPGCEHFLYCLCRAQPHMRCWLVRFDYIDRGRDRLAPLCSQLDELWRVLSELAPAPLQLLPCRHLRGVWGSSHYIIKGRVRYCSIMKLAVPGTWGREGYEGTWEGGSRGVVKVCCVV